MAKTTYNFESLDRHGISQADIDEVLASGIWEEMQPSERGNERLMFVGFTSGGRLLEAGVEYFDDEDREHIFHADDATNHYGQIFEKRTKE
jgi:uncharacterized DUF497 family protein